MQINKIEIIDWGPINKLSLQFRPLTIIYGDNETGKSAIVEAITSALFKDKTMLNNIRKEDFANGFCRVWVGGLKENKEEIFSSGSKKKLDNFFPKINQEILPLLTVHAANTKISEKSGLDTNVLEKYFFPLQQLGKIEKDLPKSIRLKEGILRFERNTPEFKTLQEINNKLKKIDELYFFIQQYNSYQQTTYQELIKIKENQLKKLLEEKRKFALLLSKQIAEYKLKITQAKEVERKIEELNKEIFAWQGKKEELDREIEELKELQSGSEGLEWLKQIENQYKEFKDNKKIILSLSIYGISFCFFFLAGYFRFKLIASLFSGLLGLLFFYMAWRLSSAAQNKKSFLKELKDSFCIRFGKELNSYSDILELIEEKEKRKILSEEKKRKIQDKREKLNIILKQIEMDIYDLTSKKIDIEQDEYKDIFLEKRRERENLEKEFLRKKELLASLNIPEGEYISAAESNYSLKEEEKLKKEMDFLVKKERELNQKLQLLFAKASYIVSDSADNINISSLIKAIKEEERRIKIQLRKTALNLFVKGVLKEAIADFKSAREKEINTIVNNPAISRAVISFTGGAYQGIKIIENEIYAVRADDLVVYKYLSTGAKDQINLALRIGIVQFVANQSSFFLILDDALQHCDYSRRQGIITMMIDLVKIGWQVIVFTMDKHIFNLLIDKSQKKLEENKIAKINLSSQNLL